MQTFEQFQIYVSRADEYATGFSVHEPAKHNPSMNATALDSSESLLQQIMFVVRSDVASYSSFLVVLFLVSTAQTVQSKSSGKTGAASSGCRLSQFSSTIRRIIDRTSLFGLCCKYNLQFGMGWRTSHSRFRRI